MASKGDNSAAYQTMLQRKIFSRWVNQKIASQGKQIEDVVNDFKSGEMLIILLECLSEVKFENWKKFKAGGSRMQNIDFSSQALAFLKQVGVQMKMMPSPENMVDGNEVQILGLVWAIMLKFMKLDDDEDDGSSLNFADALKMWIENQVKSAPYSLHVENMTKSFHDGKVFCALVHKFRPKLIDWEAASSGGATENLEKVFVAAEKYFGLEPYLQASDIAKLDDKSMVVYASEYYYGIAQQRKVDAAAKRVVQLIEYTKENDKLKAEFVVRATSVKQMIDKILPGLSDLTIENTMSGAVRRLGLFNEYRKNDKVPVFNEAAAVEAMYQDLNRRLLAKKRPAFAAEAGYSVSDIFAALKEVDDKEAVQNKALHEELNRQLKLAKLFEEFKGKSSVVTAWIDTQKEYLSKKLDILSVGEANFAINELEAYFGAFASIQAAGLPPLAALVKELQENKFEFIGECDAKQATIAVGTSELEKLSAVKKTLHQDDLARELLKAKVRGWAEDHKVGHTKHEKWMADAKERFQKKEQVESIKDAQLYLGLTRALMAERAALAGNLGPLKQLGQAVLSAAYATDLSSWTFENPNEITARERAVEDGFVELQRVGEQKLLVLDDDLQRETFRETVRQWNENHKAQYATLASWLEKSEAYCTVKEPCDSVEQAKDNLVIHKAYLAKERSSQANAVPTLQQQGQQILKAKYQTQYSSYVFTTPEEVTQREQDVLGKFAALNSLSGQKLAVLEDDLAREEFRYKVNKRNEAHIREHQAIEQWVGESRAYVDTKEAVASVVQAQDNLTVHQAYIGRQALMQEGDCVSLKALGQEVLTAKYHTALSTWVFATPEEIHTREKWVADAFAGLVRDSEAKLQVLEDDLAREQFRFKVNKWNEGHVRDYQLLCTWVDASKKYVTTKEPVDSVEQAQDNLQVFDAYRGQQQIKQTGDLVALARLGVEILTAKYETALSTWTFQTPQEVADREASAAESFAFLTDTGSSKLKVLLDDLAREQYRYKVNKWNEVHVREYQALEGWNAASKAYVEKKEAVDSVEQAQDNLQVFTSYVGKQQLKESGDVIALGKLGNEILVAEYKTDLSEWRFKTPEEVKTREATVAAWFAYLTTTGESKRLVLEDDLAREEFRFKVNKWNEAHVRQYKRIETWVGESKAYVDTKEPVDSVEQAQDNLTVLSAYRKRQALMHELDCKALAKQGEEILAAKYQTSLSSWVFATPQEVTEREAWVTRSFEYLSSTAEHKNKVQEDDLARELFRFKVNKWNEAHVRQYKAIDVWVAASKVYVDTKEPVDSVEQAQDNLAVLVAYQARQKLKAEGDVVSLEKLGNEILTAKYKTDLSEWVFKTPEEVKEREGTVASNFQYLTATANQKLLVLQDDLAREEFRLKVNKWNEQHVRQFNDLEAWIKGSNAYLDTKEPVDSVGKAQDNLVVHRDYIGRQQLMEAGDCKGLAALGQDILLAKYETPLSSWVFLTPEEVKAREAAVAKAFEGLSASSASKLAVLEDDLAREEFKFRLHLWNDQHIDDHNKLKAWVAVNLAYLAVVEPFDSIADAENNIKTFQAYVHDKADVTAINVAGFDKLGAEILAAQYKTALSEWVWEQPQDVQARLADVEASWQSLDAAAGQKQAKLDADLAKEVRKEHLRVEWAKLSGEAAGLIRDQCVSSTSTSFGFVLEEVVAFKATLDEMDTAATSAVSALKAKYDPVWTEMSSLGVRFAESPYSKLAPDDMAKLQADLQAALAARQARYAAEVAKQQADDAACVALASAADGFVARIGANKKRVAESAGSDLAAQLEAIKGVAGDPSAAALADVLAKQQVVDERAIVYNRHTLNNGTDCKVQAEQYNEFVKTKQATVEAEIEHRALRGLTKEQHAEIDAQFAQFDKDGSGFLDKKEFRSCLYSVGQERGKKEIDAILAEKGAQANGAIRISASAFKEFMIQELGDNDTEAAMVDGLKLINRFADVCKWDIMGNVLDQEYLTYIKSSHEDNYVEWTRAVFAR